MPPKRGFQSRAAKSATGRTRQSPADRHGPSAPVTNTWDSSVDHRRSHPAWATRALHRGQARPARQTGRRDRLRRRQGSITRRHGHGQPDHARSGGAPDLVITNVTIVDAVLGVVKTDVGIRMAASAASARQAIRRRWTGITPGLDTASPPTYLRLAPDPHRRRHRPHPLHLAAAGVRRAVQRRDHAHRRRHGSSDGSRRRRSPPGLEHPNDATHVRRWPGQRRASSARATATARPRWSSRSSGQRRRLQVPRGLGHHARGAALGARWPTNGRAGVHPHRHAQRGGASSETPSTRSRDARSTRSTRGLGRRPRARHHPHRGAAQRAAVVDQPTLPYGINSQARLYDMIMVCHHLSQPDIPSDVAFTESQIRAETIAAGERAARHGRHLDVLGTRLAGDGAHRRVLAARRQTADAMKTGPQQAARDAASNDNFRVLRYVQDHHQPGGRARHLARAGLGRGGQGRRPRAALGSKFFGAKPQTGDQGRRDQLGLMGDPNASLPTPQPIYYRPMFGPSAARARPASRSCRRPRTPPASSRARPRPPGDTRAQPRAITKRTWCATAARRGSTSTRRRSRSPSTAKHATVKPLTTDLPQPALLLPLPPPT